MDLKSNKEKSSLLCSLLFWDPIWPVKLLSPSSFFHASFCPLLSQKKKSCMINTGQMIMDSVQGSVYWQIQVIEQITVLRTRVEYLDISAFALFSSNLFVLFDWFPLEACSSLKRKRKVSRSWGEGEWRVASISREWQNCGFGSIVCVKNLFSIKKSDVKIIVHLYDIL